MSDFTKYGINSIEDIPTILESDFYKQAHAEQYPKGTDKLISYATARMSRIKGSDELIVFGIQAFVKRFIIDSFNRTFFNVDFDKAMEFYELVIGNTFPLKYVDREKFKKLHELGYLPIEIGCLPEGTKVPIRNAFKLPEGQCQVPFMYIINTEPGFAWVTEFLESLTSSEIWYPMCVANQAYHYRDIVNKWYNTTGCEPGTEKSAISEFGFRGGKGKEAATLASSAFLTSFNKTATIPAIIYNAMYYNEDMDNGRIGGGMISTEHSVMCSNYAVDEDEETFLRRLFTELYPSGAVSVVMDTYDYWLNLFRCGNGVLFDIIMKREGTVFFRGDSGDPVDIICGYNVVGDRSILDELEHLFSNRVSYERREEISGYLGSDICVVDEENKKYLVYHVDMSGKSTFIKEITWYEQLGTVGLLYKFFGGKKNDAGYIVLDSHVRAIYGDSITPSRAEAIYRRLALKGFAACNVALGAGSFSMNCVEDEEGNMYPFTRDSYGIAVKATWCENANGNEYQLFKNPITDTGKFKKSQKGLIYVTKDDNGEIVAYDNYTKSTLPANGNMLQPIFRDGKMINEVTLTEVRNRIHNNKF